MAIPTLFATGSTDAVNALSYVYPSNPSSLAVDDILIGWMVSGDSSGATMNFPAGWIEQDITADDDIVGANFGLGWRRVTDANESDDVIAFTQSLNGRQLFAGIFAVRGCETSGTPWDTFNRIEGDNVYFVTMSAMLTQGADRKLVTVCGEEDNRPYADDATNYIQQWTELSTVGSDAGYAVYYQDAATEASYSTDYATVTENTENHIFWTMDFKPPGSTASIAPLRRKMSMIL